MVLIRAVLACLCLVLLLAVPGKAFAIDQGEAYYSCMAKAAQMQEPGWYGPSMQTKCELTPGRYDCKMSGPATANAWTNCIGGFFYPYSSSCSQRNVTYPPGDMQPSQAAPVSDCYGGCKMVGTSVTATTGGITIYGMVNRTYVDEVCSKANSSNAPIDAQAEVAKETAPKSPECTAIGNGQTGCVKPNGDYCATASTGKTFCWTPGQEGAQVDGEDAQVKGETGDPVKPPDVAIPDKDWQRKEGHQVTECTGSSCKTSNVTNYGTVPGGTAKNSTGDNKPDGTGNTSGNGSTAKPGEGEEGEKDSATDSGNCTTPPVCVGDTLKCLHLKYTWKIECNTKGNEVTAGQGCAEGDVPVCTGSSCKAEAYAQVLQQWKQRCAVEAMAAGNATRAQGISNSDDDGVLDSIWLTPNNNGLTLRQDLVTVSGGGSLLPDVEIEGQSWTVPQGFYDAITAIRYVIIAMCTVMAMFIVGRNI